MQDDIFTKIRKAVLDVEMKKLPKEKVVLEYNFELPDEHGIKADEFLGLKARFNKDVKEGAVNTIYSF